MANPLDFRNTVGGELADMFKARGIEDFEKRLSPTIFQRLVNYPTATVSLRGRKIQGK